MNEKLKKLLAERANVWEQTKAHMTVVGERSMTAEEIGTYEAFEADLARLDKEIGTVERHLKMATQYETVETDPIVNPGDLTGQRDDTSDDKAYRGAFTSYLRGGVVNLDMEQRKILMRGQVNDPEVRAQSVGTTTAGGFLVPPDYRDEFIIKMKDFGAVQRVAQVFETDNGANLQWPTMDDTGNVGAILAENTQMAEQDIALTSASLDAYMYYSKLTRASYQLVQDSAFDVDAVVKNAHAERIARITNQHFTTGTGTAQPDGIVTSAVSGVTAAGVAAITADELIDLVHSVDPAYRGSPRARFMLSDTALKSLRKLKDLNGMYLWQPSVQAGVASNLFGYPYEINTDMAVPATGVKSVLFGDFYAGYVIRIVRGIQVITFNERYADFLQVAWASYMRADGTVQNTAAYKALTQA